MTMQEAAERYSVPPYVFEEYNALFRETKKAQAQSYDEADIQRMSFLMTLHDGGFTGEEAKRYMQLLDFGEDSLDERLRMLSEKRVQILGALHKSQEQLECLDYLRCSLFQTMNR